MSGGANYRRARSGYTLIELLISAGAAAVLVAGMASTLYISSKALTPEAPAAADANRSALGLSQLVSDVRHAQQFTERTARAITFKVPDRNGDLVAETIRYSWSGTAGDPLLYSYNNGAARTLVADVKEFKLSALTRLISDSAIEDPGNLVIYESFAEAKTASGATANNLTISAPAGVAAGNLLVAVMVIDAGNAPTLTCPGWNLVARLDRGSDVGMGVWWKIAGASEPNSYNIAWTGLKKAYGWIMRFSGNHAASPINTFATATGAGSSPLCPAVTTSVENALILRLGGFDDDDITVDNAGIAGYTTISVDRSLGADPSASGGAAYATLSAIGSSGTASMALTASEEYVTFTLALAPDN
jgi:hypothetical protein